MKSIPERRFQRMIKDRGCIRSVTSSNEYAIRYGDKICHYAVWHAKGSKREVGVVYVKRFLKLTDALIGEK